MHHAGWVHCSLKRLSLDTDYVFEIIIFRVK
jgi:hypothetical protein